MQAVAITWRRFSGNVISKKRVGFFRNAVNVAFSDKYLLFTNVSISFTLSAMGDVIEQSIELYTEELEKYNKNRTMHMATSGCTVGVLCHHWYKILDKVIVGKTFSMVMRKLLLDQLVFSPIMLITFFATLAMFEPDPWNNFKQEVRLKFSTLYCAEWLVWPPAQIINFYFLPTKFRVLYDNVISLGYDIYISHIKHKKCSPDDL